MPKLSREQMLAIAALGMLLILCGTVIAVSLRMRIDAAAELAQRQDVLDRLVARQHARTDPQSRSKPTAAPASAFLNAATLGLASADLQAYVARLAERHAALVSFGSQSPGGEKVANAVRIEASMDISLGELQVLLYQIESGTPYVYVDSVTAHAGASGAGAGRGSDTLLLRVTLGLRALWHRGTS